MKYEFLDADNAEGVADADRNLLNAVLQLQTDVKAAAPYRKGRLQQSIKGRLRKKKGLPQKVTIAMSLEGLYVFKGFGKGRKFGSGKEKPNDFINPALEKNLQNIADRVADLVVEKAVDAIVFSRKT